VVVMIVNMARNPDALRADSTQHGSSAACRLRCASRRTVPAIAPVLHML